MVRYYLCKNIDINSQKSKIDIEIANGAVPY